MRYLVVVKDNCCVCSSFSPKEAPFEISYSLCYSREEAEALAKDMKELYDDIKVYIEGVE